MRRATQWRRVADQLRGKFPKLGALMDEAENDVLAFMTFPRAHWTQIYSTNPLERLNGEIKRRTERRRHLPERRLHRPTGRRHDARAERRVGRSTAATCSWKPSPHQR